MWPGAREEPAKPLTRLEPHARIGQHELAGVAAPTLLGHQDAPVSLVGAPGAHWGRFTLHIEGPTPGFLRVLPLFFGPCSPLSSLDIPPA
jgi:hypothetical protein